MFMNNKRIYGDLTEKIIGIAYRVHRYLGQGFLESVYVRLLADCYELEIENFSYKRQVLLDLHYKDTIFKNKFKADLIIENKILVELKAKNSLDKADEAQLINYLKVTGIKVGLLFNFGADKLQIMRRVY